jgi:hypothetical protein
VTEERPGIFGLETEHAILYVPDEPDEAHSPEGSRPPFELIQRILFDCLLSGRKAGVSSGIKDGYFLENGGLVHLEIFLRNPSDVPILEVATPECRSPWDLLVYSRAYDEILEETSRRSAALLELQGYRGRIAFGKNNRDSFGVGYGCHENYLVYSSPTTYEKVLWILTMPFLLVCYFFIFLHIMTTLMLGYSWMLLSKAFPRMEASLRRAHAWISRRRPGLGELLPLAGFIMTNVFLYPAIHLSSLLLRLLAFRVFTRQLTSHLVTRQIMIGSGSINFRKGAYEISQRAELTKTLGNLVILGKRKTIFDFKGFLFEGFLFDPLALFRPTKKLTVTVGDSNLSDVPNLLKSGSTALVIEMLEAGETFGDLRLANPVKALKIVSLEGPWKRLKLRSGKRLTAMEIQREYLRRTKVFYKKSPPGRLRHDEILKLWEEVLDKLEEGPQTLQNCLDWVAKKSLLDSSVLSQTNWKSFFAWGKVFERAGLEAASRAVSLGDLLKRAPARRRFFIRRLARKAGLDPSDFAKQRDLHFQARKIDLRYHELGGETSYERALESGGCMRVLTQEDAVARAMKEPPPDTRARVRGYYIQKSYKPEMLHVNWNEIELLSPLRHIPTPDPFAHRLPVE